MDRQDNDDSPQLQSVEEQLKELRGQLEQIVEILGPSQLDTNRLWSISDVALYMGVSEVTARRVMGQHGAPKPVRFPTSKQTKSAYRWAPVEVQEFALRISNRVKMTVNY